MIFFLPYRKLFFKLELAGEELGFNENSFKSTKISVRYGYKLLGSKNCCAVEVDSED